MPTRSARQRALWLGAPCQVLRLVSPTVNRCGEAEISPGSAPRRDGRSSSSAHGNLQGVREDQQRHEVRLALPRLQHAELVVGGWQLPRSLPARDSAARARAAPVVLRISSAPVRTQPHRSHARRSPGRTDGYSTVQAPCTFSSSRSTPGGTSSPWTRRRIIVARGSQTPRSMRLSAVVWMPTRRARLSWGRPIRAQLAHTQADGNAQGARVDGRDVEWSLDLPDHQIETIPSASRRRAQQEA